MELYAKVADLGCRKAHYSLADFYHKGGYLKKAKFHCGAAAMTGCEVARHNFGVMDYKSGKKAKFQSFHDCRISWILYFHV
jgi:hypothetical protein